MSYAVPIEKQPPPPVPVAVIAGQRAPYREHVLRRVARELPGVYCHHLLTHQAHENDQPWLLPDPGHVPEPVRFQHALEPGRISNLGQCRRLFHEVRDYLLAHNIGLVFLNGYNDPARLMLIGWARRVGLPVVLSGDSNAMALGRTVGAKGHVKRAMLRWVLARVAGLAPMGVCGQAFFRSFADHDLPEFLMPYQCDAEALRTVGRARRQSFIDRHQLAPGRKRMLVASRLVKVKRVDEAIKAFCLAAAELPEWDLLIAGAGPLREPLEQAAPPGLRDRVRFLGFLQSDELAGCYHACDALLHAAEYEPWGVVIEEAVIAQLPVVCTNITGAAAELVRDRVNGRLTAPRRPERMAEAILETTRPETLAAMRNAAPAVHAQWRLRADPVAAVQQAVESLVFHP